jgi:site-specific DNA-methyltransferase (adenine-specific)
MSTLDKFYSALKQLPAPAYDDGQGRVLIAGDSLRLLADLPPGFVDVTLTDPPYSSGGAFRSDRVQSTSDKYRMTGTVRQDPDFAGDSRDQRSYERWSVAWMNAAYHATRPGGVMLAFTDWRQIAATVDAVQVAGFILRGVSVWDKTEAVRPQLGYFRQQAEFIVGASRGPFSRGKSDDGFASPGVFRHFLPGRSKQHLTEKPAAVLQRILATRYDWETVLDPFAGSGSTLIAARRLGRCALGIELDPAILAGAVERLRTDSLTEAA